MKSVVWLGLGLFLQIISMINDAGKQNHIRHLYIISECIYLTPVPRAGDEEVQISLICNYASLTGLQSF